MNRCEVCDKTDELDKVSVSFDRKNGNLCQECREQIFSNLEEISLNDPLEVQDFIPIEQDGDWFEVALPEVPEQ